MDAIATAGVAVVDGASVLLIEHGESAGHLTGSWGIPAGGIDPGETERDAAARELAEETGLRVEPHALVELPTLYEAWIARKIGGTALFSVRVFATANYTGSIAASEEGTPHWVRVADVGSIEHLLPNTAEIVKAAAAAVLR